jgi:CheY-like chemotaxis protein
MLHAAVTRNRPLAFSRVEGLPLNPGQGLDVFLACLQATQSLSSSEQAVTTEKEPGEPVPEAAALGGDDRSEKPDVLIVEDDEDEVRIITRAVRRHGMASRFKIVRSGEAALTYLEEDAKSTDPHGAAKPKVILLDLKLSGIGGREVLRRIRAHDGLCTIPVVILSSSSNSEELCECYRLGANSFVPKPVQGDHPGDHVLEIARYWLDLNRPVADG